MTLSTSLRRGLLCLLLTAAITACTDKNDGGGTGGDTDTTSGDSPVTVADYGPAHDTVFEVGGIRFYMKYVPAGSFHMGASSQSGSPHYDAEADNSVEAPVHAVALSGFLMGETEVSQALFLAVMGYNPAPDNDINLPVRAVNYADATLFLSKLSYATGYRFRMPTEAEWEYAARGAGADSAADFSFSGSSNANAVAWYEENAGGMPHPLALKRPNTLGIYDLSGNVAEWCSDWYAAYGTAGQRNPQGPVLPAEESRQRHVVRGGTYADGRYYLRNTWRTRQFPSYEGNDVGIRLVMSTK